MKEDYSKQFNQLKGFCSRIKGLNLLYDNRETVMPVIRTEFLHIINRLKSNARLAGINEDLIEEIFTLDGEKL